MKALIRSGYSTLSTRVRDPSKERVNDVDIAYYDDDNLLPVE